MPRVNRHLQAGCDKNSFWCSFENIALFVRLIDGDTLITSKIPKESLSLYRGAGEILASLSVLRFSLTRKQRREAFHH